jgi:hypothetical protein
MYQIMTLTKRFLISLLSIFIFSQCTKNSNEINVTEFSDYDIYSAILAHGFETLKEPIVIQETTNVDESLSFSEGVYDDYLAGQGVGKGLFETLVANNREVAELEVRFDIAPRQVLLLTRAELSAAFTPEGQDESQATWQEFYKQYPNSGGYIQFSKVGFDRRGTEALVAFGHYFGNLGADGGFIHLKREGDVWVLKKWFYVWAS